MRLEVDLTEDRDFRKVNNDNPFRFGIKKSLSFKPNRFNLIEDISDKDTGAIMQGNYEDRFCKIGSYEFCRGNYCDCCGKEIYPYNKDTLCNKCGKTFNISNEEIVLKGE